MMLWAAIFSKIDRHSRITFSIFLAQAISIAVSKSHNSAMRGFVQPIFGEVVHVQICCLLPFFVKLFDLWTTYFEREIMETVSRIGIMEAQICTYGMIIPERKLASRIGALEHIKCASRMPIPETCLLTPYSVVHNVKSI
ncbi:hypothetical protein JHK84_038387 [Glycine max]|uniref:Uncharacterized protein n=1 Tax=Glycine max TaxID=3847 RepID=K7M394_SOYBN|nr:hypothetical protein JHK86_038167 [Glycine max]KAG5131990.1 hypothetical protein JHK84_038387 [Glycine max]KAH1104571.1 hypothetical protein GYH30_038119 [Glycine max]